MSATSDTVSPHKKTRRIGIVPVLVLLLVAGGFILWRQYFKTYHLKTVQPGVLYRDGNQSLREFSTAVRKVKPKTVVSLIDDKELGDPEKKQFQQEAEHLKEQGVNLVRIPIKLGGWPTQSDVSRFLDVATKPENQPVLVHCAQGVRRTGFMVAAFQEKVLKFDDDRAKREIETFGHSERTVTDIKRFIEGYDPLTGKVPEGLAAGKE